MTERERFEKWALSKGLNLSLLPSAATYADGGTWKAWYAWQAARAEDTALFQRLKSALELGFDAKAAEAAQYHAAMKDYLPPGGVSEHNTLTRIIAAVDPWPEADPGDDHDAEERPLFDPEFPAQGYVSDAEWAARKARAEKPVEVLGEELGFTIDPPEEPSPRILRWADSGCRPVRDEECALWDARHALLEEVKRLKEAVRWIPVEERLPQDQQTVAFVIAGCSGHYDYLNGRVLGGIYRAGQFGGFSVPWMTVSASHWRPLEPPTLTPGEKRGE